VPNRANTNGERGEKFERDVRDYLRDAYWPGCERRGKQFAKDRGDLVGGPEGWVLDCKDHAQIDLASFIDQAEQESRNARVGFFAAIVKRRRRPVKDAYVVMPLHVFVEIAEVYDSCRP
jgi:hypothetical protein